MACEDNITSSLNRDWQVFSWPYRPQNLPDNLEKCIMNCSNAKNTAWNADLNPHYLWCEQISINCSTKGVPRKWMIKP
jgi:hypothetical protein